MSAENDHEPDETGPAVGAMDDDVSVTVSTAAAEPPADAVVAAEPRRSPEPAPTGVVRSSGIVALGTLLSRITGLVRTILTGSVLGGIGLGTAYNLANNTPNMIYDLLLGGVLSATLVPVLVGNRERDDDAGTAAVLTVSTVGLVVVTLATVVLAPAIIGAYAGLARAGVGEPSQAERDLAVALLRLFAPQVLFYGLTTLGSAYLNSAGRFAAAAFAPVVNNIWMMLILASAAVTLGERTVGQIGRDPLLVWLLGAGTTVGIMAMALVLLPAISMGGLPLRWNFDLHNSSVKEIVRLGAWTFGYVVSNQVCLFVLLGLAGQLVWAWHYAYQFFQLPYGVVTVSIMTALAPELARLGAQRRLREFRERYLQGFRLVLLAILPATVLFALLARPLIWVVFVRGRFTADDAGPTASTLMALSWGMVGFSVYLYALRGFTVLKDTRTPFVINVIENALTLVLAWVLVGTLDWHVDGLAWAWSGGYLVCAVLAFAWLRWRMGPFGFDAAVATTATVIRMVMATLLMLGAVLAVRIALPDTEGPAAWANLAGGTAAGLAVYIGALFVLGVREVRELPRMVLRRA